MSTTILTPVQTHDDLNRFEAYWNVLTLDSRDFRVRTLAPGCAEVVSLELHEYANFYCPSCGEEVAMRADVCTFCEVPVGKAIVDGERWWRVGREGGLWVEDTEAGEVVALETYATYLESIDFQDAEIQARAAQAAAEARAEAAAMRAGLAA